MEKWFLKNTKADLVDMSNKFNISKLLSRILVNRGISDYNLIDSFINPTLDKFHNPRLMKDMEKGVSIAKESILNNEKIRICGDYDQDGNSAILTLYKGIKRCNGNVDYVIPHRVKDGYGINERIIKEAKEDGISLIITCDNGVSAFDAVNLARELGIKIIITDHHQIDLKIPEADAVINPKRSDCKYPFKELCGAGVAFKFIQVLYDEMDINIGESYGLLEFVAMGTVCDIVDLVDENRIIVIEGLKRINKTNNIGLKALMKASGFEGKTVNAYTLGFVIGPSVNAAGRLDSADIAVEMFLTKDEKKADYYANKLHSLNEERKSLTEDGFKKVVDQIESSNIKEYKILVVYEPDIHESVAGIIAGRVKDKYYKPTIVLTNSDQEGILKGSGRSIDEYDMFQEISKSKEFLVGFGGHPMAAGLSIEKSKLKDFRDNLNGQAILTDEDMIAKVYIDLQLPIKYVSFDLVRELNLLEPFGKGNSKPLFGDKNLLVKKAFILGKNKNVLKLLLYTEKTKTIEALYFGDVNEFVGLISDEYGEVEVEKMFKGIDNNIRLDLTYYPNINEYMGNKNLQIFINNYRF